MDQTTFIVLGHARSGTSMASGLLHIVGVDMNPVHNPSSQTPKGAYENKSFNDLTVEMTQDVVGGLDAEALCRKYAERVQATVRDLSAGRPRWGWKSALTHHCLDAFMQHVPDPRFVFCFRNPLQNAQSFVVHVKEKQNKDLPLGSALGDVGDSMKVLARILARHSDVPRCFVTYEGMKADPLGEAGKLADFVGVDMTPEIEENVKEFILPNYTTLPPDGAEGIASEEAGEPSDGGPEAVAALVERANACVEKQDLTGAQQSLTEALGLAPGNLWLIVTRANVMVQLGDAESARNEFLKATNLDPDSIDAHAGLGVCLLHLGRYDEAEASARRAIELDGVDVENVRLLSHVYVEAGKTEQAIRTCLDILRKEPDDLDALLALSRCYFEKDEMPLARLTCQKALQIDPGNELAAENLAVIEALPTT